MRRQTAPTPRSTEERRSRRRRRLGTLFVAVVGAISLLAAAPGLTAVAGFDDVDETRFFAEAVEWAKTNGITTGSPAGSSTFKPFDPVTRGENVTFAQRYDENVVQPALAEVHAALPVMATATSNQFTSSVTTEWLPLEGMAVTFTVPPGATHEALITFSASHQCSQDPLVSVWCSVRARVDDAAVGPEVFPDGGWRFSSVGHSGDDATQLPWGSHTAQWVTGPLDPGEHTVHIEFRVDEGNATFTLAERVLSVISMPTS